MKKKFKISSFDNKTLSWWWNKKEKIDMDPPYQRKGKLWSETDKAYLIDSIINGYDIPKLYMADFTWGDSNLNQKKLPYAIIDGKQRLEAIFDFFEGNIVLNSDFTYLVNPALKLGGLGYRDLLSNNKEIAEEFANYNLMVMSVVSTDEEPINELFLRLNRSKPLTGAEIRNAMSGPTNDIIRKIALHDFFTNNVKFNVARGEDKNVAGKILSFEYYQDFRETTKRHLDNFVKNTQKENKEKIELAGRYVIDLLNDMSNIFLPKDSLLSFSGIIPVYYWLVRSIAPFDYPFLRKFLVDFEETRKNHRSTIKNDPNNIDVNLIIVEFETLNRNTNNLQSHRGRFNILYEAFEYWKVHKRLPIKRNKNAQSKSFKVI